MNIKNYKNAQGYAFKLSPANYKDIVHTAYLTWFDKTGKDLFDEHIGTISRTIKLTLMKESQQYYFMFNGEKYPKKFSNSDDLVSHSPSPLDIVIENEEAELFEKKAKELTALMRSTESFVFSKFKSGMTSKEIVAETGISSALISYYKKILKQKFTNN